jgi:hypothetical protein
MQSLRSLLAGLALISTVVFAQADDAPAVIEPGSVKRVAQGIEAKVRITHDPIASDARPDRSYNESVVTMVVRCRDKHIAWKVTEKYQAYANRELIEVTEDPSFFPAESDGLLSASVVDRLCTSEEYASLPAAPRPVDADLSPMTLVCNVGSAEAPNVQTFRVNFADGTVNESIASISPTKIEYRFTNRFGRTVSHVIDRYAGTLRSMVSEPTGDLYSERQGTCEKRSQRAF